MRVARQYPGVSLTGISLTMLDELLPMVRAEETVKYSYHTLTAEGVRQAAKRAFGDSYIADYLAAKRQVELTADVKD